MTDKRARLNEIRKRVFVAALELFAKSDSDKLSFEEAQRQAAQQLATTERTKPQPD
jgi:hypothetical protein